MKRRPLRSLFTPRAYTSDAAFNVEQGNIFGNQWGFAGLDTDLPAAGDTSCVSLGPHHLILVRGEDGTLRAFHNLCRHRGTRLLTARGKGRKMLVCPYHRWVYDLEGSLRGVPDREQFPGLDRGSLPLHPAAVTVWKGLVFVHPEPGPPSFADWLGELPERLGPHGPETLTERAPAAWEVRANWKVFLENAIDGYHLRHLHADTLGMYDHSRQRSSFVGRHWTFAEPPTDAFRQTMKSTPRSWLLVDPDDPDAGNRVHLVFPNLLITESESDWSLLQVVPEAPDRTRLLLRSFGPDVKGVSSRLRRWFWSGDENAPPPATDPLASGDFMQEDILVCERQQEAMSSPRFSIGALADDYERDIVSFQHVVLDHLDIKKEHCS